MQLSKNAVGNLINRYKSVLNKCNLLNTFGTLAIIGVLTLGVGLANMESAFATSLSDISSDINEPSGDRTAGTLRSPRDVTLSHITGTGGIDSTIESGASLTLTGSRAPNGVLIEDNMINMGKLELGTGLDSSATGIIGGYLKNSAGNITAQSKLEVKGNLTLEGGTATFESDLTVDSITTFMGGTNDFNGVSTFTRAVDNNGGINTFSGTATFNVNYNGTGSASFNGETTFIGDYTNTGTSTFTNNTTFEQQYTAKGTLNVDNGTTNFEAGYTSAGTLNVGDASNAANAKVTIGTGTTMSIYSNGTLNIANGTVDVSNGTLTVDSGAATFKTGTNGVLIAKAEDFGTFTDASGVLTVSHLLTKSVEKQLDNDGRLILTGLNGSMNYTEYKKLLHTTDGLITGGTVQLENVSISTAGVYLKNIQTGTDIPNSVVLGNDNTLSDGGTFASGTAIIGGVNGNMNNLGTLTLTGANGMLVQGNAENSGVLNLQNGSITGSLTNNDTVNINGATVVDGFTTLGSATANLNVQGGSFTVRGNTTLNGGTLRTSGLSGNSINQASATFLPTLPNDIDGHIIAEQGSYVVLGAGDSNFAINAFSSSNQDWGTNLTAALFISSPQKLKDTGSILVNGANTGLSAAGANNATFAANSILVVDAAGLNGNVALTSTSGSGKLIVESGAKLHIANAVSGSTVHIVSGFTGAGGSMADKAWDGDNLTNSTALQAVKVADFNQAIGTYSVTITGSSASEIAKDFPAAQDESIKLVAELAKVFNVNSEQESIRFMSVLFDDNSGLGRNNPTETVKVLESVLQLVQTGAGASVGAGASLGAANNILTHLSRAGFNFSGAGTRPASVQVGQGGQDGQSISSGSTSINEGLEKSIKNGLALWISPMYKYSSVQGVEVGVFDHGYNSSIGGLSLGADYTFDDAFRVGLAFNVGKGYVESTGSLSQTYSDLNFWGLSLYGAYYNDNFSLMADVGFISTHGHYTQDVPNTLGVSSVEAYTQTTTFTAGLMAEYTFKTDFMDITPHVGVRYMHIHTGGYDTENSRGLVAQTEASIQNLWYFPVGVMFSKDFEFESDWTFTPHVDLGVIFATGDLHSTSVSSIPGVSGAAEYTMQTVDSFAFNGSVGFNLANDNGLSVALNYNLQASEHETGHMFNLTLKYEF